MIRLLIERGQSLELQMLVSWQRPGVSASFTNAFFLLFLYHPACPREHSQRSVATACASTAASVGRDQPSFATVLQGSTDPAASTVRRNIPTAFHIQTLRSPLHISMLIAYVHFDPASFCHAVVLFILVKDLNVLTSAFVLTVPEILTLHI